MRRGIVLAFVVVAGAMPIVAEGAWLARVKITPSPFYSDLARMRVSFVTPNPAPPGRLYFAWWQTLAPPSTVPKGCAAASKITSKGTRGGRNTRVTLNLYPEPLFGDAFCPGPSEVVIFTQRANASGYVPDNVTGGQRLLTRYRFRVFRPR